MNIKELMRNIKTMTSDQIENKLDHLVHSNYRFSNLSEQNKDLILDIIKDYKEDIKNGIKINSSKIFRDTHRLYEKRASLGLSQEDLKDIKKILEAFKA